MEFLERQSIIEVYLHKRSRGIDNKVQKILSRTATTQIEAGLDNLDINYSNY